MCVLCNLQSDSCVIEKNCTYFKFFVLCLSSVTPAENMQAAFAAYIFFDTNTLRAQYLENGWR